MTNEVVIRWYHSEPMMNMGVLVELNGAVMWVDPFWPETANRLRVLIDALGLPAEVQELDKFVRKGEA